MLKMCGMYSFLVHVYPDR